MTAGWTPRLETRPLLLCAALAWALSGCQCVRADEVVLVGCGPSGECSGATRCCADLLCHASCEDPGADAGRVDAGLPVDGGSPVDAGLPPDAGGEPVTLTISSAPVTSVAGQCAPAPMRVELRDAIGARASVRGSPLAVLVSSAPAGLTFFDDAACANALPGSTWSLAPGSSEGQLYFQATSAFPAPLGVQVTLLASTLPAPGNTVQQLQFVEPGPPARLAWLPSDGVTPVTQTVASDECSAAFTLEVQDRFGNPSPLGVATPVTPSASPGVTFWATPGCGSGALALAPTATQVQLFARAATAQIFLLTATAGALTSADPPAQFTVSGPPATQLAFLGTPGAVTAGTCRALTLEARSQLGGRTTVNSSTAVTLSTPLGAAQYFVGPNCTGIPTTTVALAPGSAEVTFGALLAGVPTTTVQATAFPTPATASQSWPVNAAAGTGTLAVSAPNPDLEVFDCEPLEVTRVGGSGPWTLGETTLTVSLPSGTAELKLHADSNCTGAGSLSLAATIPDGSTTTRVYVRGQSGAPTAVSVTATDGSNAFASGAVTVTAVPLVRRGACVLPANTTSVTCSISPALAATDLDHTFMVYQATGNQLGAGAAGVVCAMQSTSAIACSRWVAGTSPMDLTWQTASWGRHVPGVGGVRVQHLQGVTAAVLGPVDVPFKPVASLANTFVLFGHSTEGTSLNSNDWATAVPLSTETLRLTTTSFGLRYSYQAQIVEFEGAAVERASYTGVATGAGFTLTGLTSMIVGRTAMLFTSRQDTLNDDAAICKRTWRGQVTAADGLAFTRGAGTATLACTNNSALETAWQRLQFPSGTAVQRCEATIGGGIAAAAATTCALPTAVTAHRTLVWLSGQGPGGQAMGESAHATTDDLGHVNAGVTLTGPTQVTVTRGSNTSTPSVFTPTAIEFSFP